jgi:dipeptidyl aminopeptidase/acylaminoacyl peptidase
MLSRLVRTLSFLLAFLMLPAALTAATQKSSLDATLDGLFATAAFPEAAISPNGKNVAWVVKFHKSSGAMFPESGIYVASLASPSAAPRRVTAGGTGTAFQDVAWSPDSRELAFVSDAQTPGHLQLYIASAAGAVARKVTHLTGSLAAPKWSPDGKSLALLFIENAAHSPGPMQPAAVSVGELGGKILEQRLAMVDLSTGQARQLTPADMNVYEYDWSPDGKRFAAIAAHGDADNNWYLAELYIVDGTSGETKLLYKPSLQICVPRCAPDGKGVAFICGLMSDEGNNGGDLYYVPWSGGEARNLTPEMKATATWFTWRGGDEILFTENLDGTSGIATLGVASGETRLLWSGPETISVLASAATRNLSVSLARDGQTSAVIRESGATPPEVWAGPIGEWKQITHANRDAHVTWGKDVSIHWPSDEFSIQGWLTYPRDYDPTQRYPMVVQIHGGPGSVSRPRWPLTFFDFTLLSQEGYFVLRPNIRGGFGWGEAFTRANVKDIGHGELRDILAGVDYVVKNFPVDNDRVGLGGWSHGGYMTMWAVTQTNRFHAALAGAGIANWQSYYGQNGIDQWMIPFFGASVYDDPEIYARSSPMTFIKNVKTPTLIMVGERDGECPPPQSMEFWHALRVLGVDNQLMIYPGEGHNVADPEHRHDIMRRMSKWFDHYLK